MLPVSNLTPSGGQSGYLWFQLWACGPGSLLDLQGHLSKELLALANLLAQGLVVPSQAQDVAATRVGPQAVASNQVGHTWVAGDRAATVAGEGVRVIFRGRRSL